jgi:hypothetical protein
MPRKEIRWVGDGISTATARLAQRVAAVKGMAVTESSGAV